MNGQTRVLPRQVPGAQNADLNATLQDIASNVLSGLTGDAILLGPALSQALPLSLSATWQAVKGMTVRLVRPGSWLLAALVVATSDGTSTPEIRLTIDASPLKGVPISTVTGLLGGMWLVTAKGGEVAQIQASNPAGGVSNVPVGYQVLAAIWQR